MAGSGENIVMDLESVSQQPGAPTLINWQDTAAPSSSSNCEQSYPEGIFTSYDHKYGLSKVLAVDQRRNDHTHFETGMEWGFVPCVRQTQLQSHAEAGQQV